MKRRSKIIVVVCAIWLISVVFTVAETFTLGSGTMRFIGGGSESIQDAVENIGNTREIELLDSHQFSRYHTAVYLDSNTQSLGISLVLESLSGEKFHGCMKLTPQSLPFSAKIHEIERLVGISTVKDDATILEQMELKTQMDTLVQREISMPVADDESYSLYITYALLNGEDGMLDD